MLVFRINIPDLATLRHPNPDQLQFYHAHPHGLTLRCLLVPHLLPLGRMGNGLWAEMPAFGGTLRCARIWVAVAGAFNVP